MNDPINDYFKLEDEVFKMFGYVEDWVKIPIVDHREYFWYLEQDEHGSGSVIYYEHLLTPDILDSGEYYSSEIYTQRFLPKWVYREEDHTMICMDTQCDGNKFLGIFLNMKEHEDNPNGDNDGNR